MEMTEASDCHTARKRRRITLIQSDDDSDEKEQGVFVGNRISETAISRSGLLSGLENTTGHASLPRQLLPEEIRLWETACAVDVRIPSDEMSTVLKVADAMGDEKTASWVAKLAKRVIDTNWRTGTPKADAMLCALLRLPAHLLHSILTDCIPQLSLDVILTTWPPSLHLPALSAAVQHPGNAGSLSFSSHNAAASALHLLTIPATATTSLKRAIIQASRTTPPPPPSSGALLAWSAAALTSLTSLGIKGRPVSPDWLRRFAANLPRAGLSSIVGISVSADAHPGGCAALISCLSRLPALSHVEVSFHLPREAPACQPKVSLSAYTHLTGARAALALPMLQSMTFHEGGDSVEAADRVNCMGHVDSPSCSHQFLPLIQAPGLTKLQLSTAAFLPVSSLLAAVALARYPVLEQLQLEAALRAHDAVGLRHRVFGIKLPSLVDVHVTSTCPVSVVALGAVIAQRLRQTLTSLTLRLSDEFHINPFSNLSYNKRLLTDTWGMVFLHVRRCTALRSLHLDCLCGVPAGGNADAAPAFCAGLVTCLTCLTALTCLQLRYQYRLRYEEPALLHGASIGSVVDGLPALEQLVLNGLFRAGRMFDAVQPVLDACARVANLKHLALPCKDVTFLQANEYVTRQSGLTYLELFTSGVPGWEGIDKFAFSRRFPDIEMKLG